MTLSHDIQTLVTAIKGAREMEERIKAHKAEQAKLIQPKLLQVRDWVSALAAELTDMASSEPELFGIKPSPSPYSHVSVTTNTEKKMGVDKVTLDFCGCRIVFEPFLEQSLIQCRPDNQSYGGEHVQTSDVTEAWIRSCVINAITRYLKADNLVISRKP